MESKKEKDETAQCNPQDSLLQLEQIVSTKLALKNTIRHSIHHGISFFIPQNSKDKREKET